MRAVLLSFFSHFFSQHLQTPTHFDGLYLSFFVYSLFFVLFTAVFSTFPLLFIHISGLLRHIHQAHLIFIYFHMPTFLLERNISCWYVTTNKMLNFIWMQTNECDKEHRTNEQTNEKRKSVLHICEWVDRTMKINSNWAIQKNRKQSSLKSAFA